MVIHWNTVNIAKPILSKLVIPEFGPTQFSSHVESLEHIYAPSGAPRGAKDSISVLQGVSNSPSLIIRSVKSINLICFFFSFD